MSDVISLQGRQRRQWQANGETTFLVCGCGSQDGLLAVVLHDAGLPLLVALMCPVCENELAVVNGRVQLNTGG